jgi:hypothetical protein
MSGGNGKKSLSKEEALSARPARRPEVASKKTDDGRTLLTVRFPRPRWQRWVGATTDYAERNFELDCLGAEVYEACNGKVDVRTVIQKFATVHNLAWAEAEIAVTGFLKTLMSRGLIMMLIDEAEKQS